MDLVDLGKGNLGPPLFADLKSVLTDKLFHRVVEEVPLLVDYPGISGFTGADVLDHLADKKIGIQEQINEAGELMAGHRVGIIRRIQISG